MARITDKEISTVTAMAARKSGVTRSQIADRLKIKPTRATLVIGHVRDRNAQAFKAERLGSGKENRTVVYRLPKPSRLPSSLAKVTKKTKRKRPAAKAKAVAAKSSRARSRKRAKAGATK